MPMALKILITKFKFRQQLLRANFPNLILTKLSRYTVTYNNTDMDLNQGLIYTMNIVGSMLNLRETWNSIVSLQFLFTLMQEI